jgi:PAS domain S-box-containing protein
MGDGLQQTVLNERFFKSAFIHSPGGMAYLDLDGNWIQVNPALGEMLGYDEQQLKNKYVLTDFLHEEDIKADKNPIQYLASNGFNKWDGQFRMICEDQKLKWCNLLLTRLREPEDEDEYLLAYFTDVTEQQEQRRNLDRSNEETRLLLREVHHRVKNNLATISGLLELKAYNIENVKAREALEESLLRVKSVANVHQALYQSSNISDVSLKDYLHDLVDAVEKTYVGLGREVTLDIAVDSDISVNLDQAVPAALLLNELIVNAYQHAFENEKFGSIKVQGIQNDGKITLIVEDDGCGLDVEKWDKSDSLGHTIVQELVVQLEATMDITVDGGTRFTIVFEKPA